MTIVIKYIEQVGKFGLTQYLSLKSIFIFATQCILKLFSRKSYIPVAREVLFMQIYFTGVQIIIPFIIFSIIFGSLFIGIILQAVKSVGLTDYIGDILSGFVFVEIAPFVTVLLLSLRTSSAINTEIAVMKVNRELDTLRAFDIDEYVYLYVPRIITLAICTILLSSLFSIIVAISGFIFSNIIFNMPLRTYSEIIIKAFNFSDIVILMIKNTVFGFALSIIPLYFGSKASYQNTAIPIAVLYGMVRVFIAIIFIEVVSLAARFI